MTNNAETGLYVLKHKDLDVAMVLLDAESGKMEYVLEIYLPKELPVGCSENDAQLSEWWKSRAIPDSRKGIQQVLAEVGEKTNLSLMLSSYGLSLNDHYWMQPVGVELYWSDINFYQNPFSDELGNLLTDSCKVNIDQHISKFSPASSVTGEMKKKWMIRDGIRYLMKVNANHFGQQSVNERIACRLHERLGWKNFVPYQIEEAVMYDKVVPCSINPLFTSDELEFVSAYQLIRNEKIRNDKIRNDKSVYEALIAKAISMGGNEAEIRKQLEYTILTDFILSNTDRHLNNLGFLYHSGSRRITAMAPIFDTGNALFYSEDFIPSGENLLDVKVASFCEKEVQLLRYVENRSLVDLDLLDAFPEEAAKMLEKYTEMPKKRAEAIAETIEKKIELLQKFQQGAKLWKPEKYWW